MSFTARTASEGSPHSRRGSTPSPGTSASIRGDARCIAEPSPLTSPSVGEKRRAPPSWTAPPTAVDLDAVPADELAIVLEIDTVEDLDVIANLDLLVELVAVEAGAG